MLIRTSSKTTWPKIKPLTRPTTNNKQKGFTLFELIIVIIVISILGLFAIDRIWALRVAAEQASVRHIIGVLRSALGMEVARLALDGKMASVAQLDKSNPIVLLAQVPENYLGEYAENNDHNHINQPGVWYYNNKEKALIYNVNYQDYFKTPLTGQPRLRHQIKLVYNDQNNNNRFDLGIDSIAGLDLLALEKYSWNTTQ